MGRARARRPGAVRVPDPRRRAGRAVVGDHSPQARALSRSVCGFRSRPRRAIHAGAGRAVDEESRYRTQSPKDRRSREERARVPAGAARVRELRAVRVGVRGRKAAAERLDVNAPGSGDDRGVRCAQQGPEEAGLHVRRINDHVRVDAGCRDGERPPRRVSAMEGGTIVTRKHPAAGSDLEDRFFELSIDLLCLLNFNGHFKRLNLAWERTLGISREELMSRPFIEFVHPDDRERTLKQNAAVRAGGQALSFENRYMCKDGSYRWLRWNAAPDSSGSVIYSVARDITASKKAEEEREELVRELQRALAEVRTLREILPICSYCKKVRDDENYWHTVESYISKHTDTRFSHGICPSCVAAGVE